jgi:hypothetical protein
MRMPVILATLLLAATGCVTTSGGSLRSAADTLNSRTQRLYDVMRHNDDRGYRDRDYSDRDYRDRDYRNDYGTDDHAVRDAEALAKAADDFNRAVERGEAREELNGEFDRVAEHYHHLRDYYDNHSRDREELDRFHGVTDAYVDVEGALRYPDTEHG